VESLAEWAKQKEITRGCTEVASFTSFDYTRLKHKNVADCVEALIGAYFNNGGLDSAARVIEWLGLRGPSKKNDEFCVYKVHKKIRWPIVSFQVERNHLNSK